MVIGLVLEMTPDLKNKYKPNKRMQSDLQTASRFSLGSLLGSVPVADLLSMKVCFLNSRYWNRIRGDCSEFCVNVKTPDLSDHRSSAPSSRPSKKMANWDRVRLQFWIGMVHFLLAFCIPRYSNLSRLLSFGNPPLVLVSLRNWRCTASSEPDCVKHSHLVSLSRDLRISTGLLEQPAGGELRQYRHDYVRH